MMHGHLQARRLLFDLIKGLMVALELYENFSIHHIYLGSLGIVGV